MLDLNDAGPQRGDVIPDGSFVALQLKFKPGGISWGDHPDDRGLLKQSKTSDVTMLDVTATVLNPPHQGRNVWFNTSIDGGERDDKGRSKAGNMSKAFIRAIVESALGIDPSDTSPAANEKRKIQSLASLQSLQFFAKLGVEESDRFGAKNIIDIVLTPNMPEWAEMRGGKVPPPKPRGHRKRNDGGNQDTSKPAWQRNAAPAAPAPSWHAPAAAPAAAANNWHAPAPATSTPPPSTGGAPAPGPSWMND
jgi:hypothetical protein